MNKNKYHVVQIASGWIVQNQRFVVASPYPFKTKEEAEKLANNLNGVKKCNP